MIIMRAIRFCQGWVEWKAEGGVPERFLNLATRRKLSLHPTQRKEYALYGYCRPKEYKQLRAVAKSSGVRLRIVAKHGLPFKTYRYRHRWGLVFGLALFVGILQWLSTCIWSVDVLGNDQVSDTDIKTVMAELGVDIGAKRNGVDLRRIQLQAIESLPKLAWVAVNLEGSIAHIEVKERLEVEEPPNLEQPTNLKALCDGRILSTKIIDGQTLVKKGDAVTKDMLLVSGVVENKTGVTMVHARGEILAETERQFKVTVPFTERVEKVGKKAIRQPTLQFFSLNIPLYTNHPLPSKYQQTTKQHSLVGNKVTLPIGLTHQTYREIIPVTVNRTEKEAASIANNKLEEWKKTYLKDINILSEEKLETSSKEGYTLTVRFRCVEDIAVEVPIRIVP